MTDDYNLPINERIARAIESEGHATVSGLDWADRRDCEHRTARFGAFRDAARIARQTSPWISVDDRPPGDGREVLTFCSITGQLFLATWDSENGVFRSGDDEMIPGVLWAPLPAPQLPTKGDH